LKEWFKRLKSNINTALEEEKIEKSLLNTFIYILSAIVTALMLAYKQSRRLEGDVHAS